MIPDNFPQRTDTSSTINVETFLKAFLLSWKVFLVIAQAPLTWYTENGGKRLRVNFSKRIWILILCRTAKSLSPGSLLLKIALSVVSSPTQQREQLLQRYNGLTVTPGGWLILCLILTELQVFLRFSFRYALMFGHKKKKQPWHFHSSSNLLWLDWMSVYLIWPAQKVTQYSAVIECNYPFATGKCTKRTL